MGSSFGKQKKRFISLENLNRAEGKYGRPSIKRQRRVSASQKKRCRSDTKLRRRAGSRRTVKESTLQRRTPKEKVPRSTSADIYSKGAKQARGTTAERG